MAPPKRAAGKQSTCVLSFPALYIFLKAVRTRDPADLIPFAQFRFRKDPAFRRQLAAADCLLELLKHSAVDHLAADRFVDQFIKHISLRYLIPVLLYPKRRRKASVFQKKRIFLIRTRFPTQLLRGVTPGNPQKKSGGASCAAGLGCRKKRGYFFLSSPRNPFNITSLRSLFAEGRMLPGVPSCSRLQPSHSRKAW